jgi:hypothetical protein
MHQVRQIGSTAEELSRYFFQVKTVGRKPNEDHSETETLIVE